MTMNKIEVSHFALKDLFYSVNCQKILKRKQYRRLKQEIQSYLSDSYHTIDDDRELFNTLSSIL